MKPESVNYSEDQQDTLFVTFAIENGEILAFRMEDQKVFAAGGPFARVAEELSTCHLPDRDIRLS